MLNEGPLFCTQGFALADAPPRLSPWHGLAWPGLACLGLRLPSSWSAQHLSLGVLCSCSRFPGHPWEPRWRSGSALSTPQVPNGDARSARLTHPGDGTSLLGLVNLNLKHIRVACSSGPVGTMGACHAMVAFSVTLIEPGDFFFLDFLFYYYYFPSHSSTWFETKSTPCFVPGNCCVIISSIFFFFLVWFGFLSFGSLGV